MTPRDHPVFVRLGADLDQRTAGLRDRLDALDLPPRAWCDDSAMLVRALTDDLSNALAESLQGLDPRDVVIDACLVTAAWVRMVTAYAEDR